MKKRLHPGAKWMFRLGVFWITIFLVIMIGSFSIPLIVLSKTFSTINILGIIIIGMVFSFSIGELWVRLSYKQWFYEFNESDLKQERGVIWKTYSSVPYNKIQNIDIRRGIIARVLGFSSIYIQTAGYSVSPKGSGFSAEGYIPAVDIKEAEKIREFIIKKVSGIKSKKDI